MRQIDFVTQALRECKMYITFPHGVQGMGMLRIMSLNSSIIFRQEVNENQFLMSCF